MIFLDIRVSELIMENLINFGQDLAPEDDLLENSNRLKEIVNNHGTTLFQPFDREGLRV